MSLSSSSNQLQLSLNDAEVFRILFDAPESDIVLPPTSVHAEQLPGFSAEKFTDLDDAQQSILKKLERDGLSEDALAKAFHSFSDLIICEPDFAPFYVNRAQVQRLMLGGEINYTADNTATWDSVIDDLMVGSRLASPIGSVSSFHRSLLANTHTHLAYLLLQASKSTSDTVLPKALGGMTRDQLQEKASQHFQVASRSGDSVAQVMAIKTNPYARMCGAIVQETLRSELA